MTAVHIQQRADAELGAAWRRVMDALVGRTEVLTLTSWGDGSFTAESGSIETDEYSSPIDALEALEAALDAVREADA